MAPLHIEQAIYPITNDGSSSEQAVPRDVPDQPPMCSPEWTAPPNEQYSPMVKTEYPDDNQPEPHDPVTVADTSWMASGVPTTCPKCGASGSVKERFTTCGIICCICFFPVGVLCLLSLRERVCSQCQATF